MNDYIILLKEMENLLNTNSKSYNVKLWNINIYLLKKIKFKGLKNYFQTWTYQNMTT